MRKKYSLQKMVLGKLDNYMQKNETGPYSYIIYKNKFKIEKQIPYANTHIWNLKKKKVLKNLGAGQE